MFAALFPLAHFCKMATLEEKKKKMESRKIFSSDFELKNQAVIGGMVNCLYTVVCFLITAGKGFSVVSYKI